MSDKIESEFGSAGIYASRRKKQIRSQLGAGIEGIVFATDYQTALKAHRYRAAYEREREVYLRLKAYGVEQVAGFNVPKYLDSDDELMVIEIEHVTPPFVVDFAQALLDGPVRRTEEEHEEWEADGCEMFGRQKWEVVKTILSGFRRCKVYLADIHPRNIDFGDDED